MLSKQTLIATNRFGLGASPADIERAKENPKAWLKAQIESSTAMPSVFSDHPSSADVLHLSYKNRRIKDEAKKKASNKKKRQRFNQSLRARLSHQVQTDQPFAERLVRFWSNHFTVSRTRGLIGPAIPAYENEAIRPFIFGRFEEMLLSVTQHPCMLIYLDNISSIGPNSRQGSRRGKDLNENLAREILELHTMGAQGDYTQSDVTNFAKILTGWTVARQRKNPKNQKVPPGQFLFNLRTHEPGPQELLGKSFKQGGVNQGLEAFKYISRHPSTARFIATKLVRHFVDDAPSARDIQKIEQTFTETKGDLAAVSEALINLKSAWEMSGSKIKTPEELVISTLRAMTTKTALKLPRRQLLFPALKTMGQEIFRAPSPAGWPDKGDAWIAPESLTHRLEWIRAFSRQSPGDINPVDVFNQTIGTFASKDAARLIKGAPSRADGLALIFSSPAFQRR
jgi:uncharacterized protein (DUF1800 family)